MVWIEMYLTSVYGQNTCYNEVVVPVFLWVIWFFQSSSICILFYIHRLWRVVLNTQIFWFIYSQRPLTVLLYPQTLNSCLYPETFNSCFTSISTDILCPQTFNRCLNSKTCNSNFISTDLKHLFYIYRLLTVLLYPDTFNSCFIHIPLTFVLYPLTFKRCFISKDLKLMDFFYPQSLNRCFISTDF